MLKNLLPLNSAEEIAPLAAHGADEFYCGFMDRHWAEIYGFHDSMSRRQSPANFSDKGALKAAVCEAKNAGKPVRLALNGSYSQNQLETVVKIAESFGLWGGIGVIVRDLSLLSALKAAGLPLKITVSLLAVSLNADSCLFWQSMGADRVVFPRFLTISEMQEITSACPGLVFEAMIMDDKCPFIDGYCRAVHGTAFPRRSPGEGCSDEDADMVFTFDMSCEAHHLCREAGVFSGSGCAACSLTRLEEAGVSIGKFGGRGSPLSYRLDKLDFINMAQGGEEGKNLRDFHRTYFGPCNCYYRETPVL